VERPIRRGSRSHRLDPLPHAGTISVFLLIVVVVTGLYITLFFEYGYDASYDAVAGLEEHPIQRVFRALHRYSSAALVLTTVVHAWRILVSRRFSGRRRHWRWASGIAALVVVWLAGVTGYWLIWDIRAQALNEALIGLIGGTRWGAELAIALLDSEASGSTVLVALWFAHVILTAIIGWFLYRHVRRSQLSWMPPRHWMVLMTGALVLVSLALPAGMLDRADPGRLTASMPIDPFVLFLLPPLLSGGRWLAVAVAVAMGAGALFLPRLLDRRRNEVVVIDPEACTGCELCVVDCPYLALTMVDRTEPSKQEGQVAELDPAACVACGICVGSCAFGAIDLPGSPGSGDGTGTTGGNGDGPGDSAAGAAGEATGWRIDGLGAIDPGGRPVVIVCDRHLLGDGHQVLAAELDDPVVVPVRCAGMFNTQAVDELARAGAASVQLVGCAPADCRYGTGNLLASARLDGSRRPHVPRRWSGLVAEDWVASTELRSALRDPGRHPTADASQPPGGRETMVGAALLVLISMVAVGFATRAPFRTAEDRAAIRVVVDHEPGAELDTGSGPVAIAPGPVSLRITIDGSEVSDGILSSGDGRTVGLVDIDVPPGETEVEVVLAAGGDEAVLLDDLVDLSGGQRLVVDAGDVPLAPGASEGREVFNSRAAGCTVCHSVKPGDDGVGPSLAGLATRAGTRVEGLDGAGYIRQSILLPDQYVVDGYPAGQMLPIYMDDLSPEQIDALIAFLLTLEEGG
jgi:Fe-S-cluster-containing hydrogenase component 2/mono/diheme cytochrome c family protein